MTPTEAIRRVREEFPFAGYLGTDDTKYLATVEPVLRYLRAGDKILDFGSGPCDNTAILQHLGFQCTAYDDLADYWHQLDDNRQKILDFARHSGIDFMVASEGPLPFEKHAFSMVMLNAVIEHLHDSPRDLLNDLLECVRPEGYLYITVPSAVNIRKRLSVLRGQTNYPPFDTFYWHPGPWRGHVREYTRGDLQRLASFLGLSVVELHSYHKMLSRIPRAARWVYRWVTAACTGWRDSWLLIAKKNPNWQPRKALSDEEFRRRLGNDEGFQY